MRATKITCTLGKESKSQECLVKMMKMGMDVARINMNYFEVHE